MGRKFVTRAKQKKKKIRRMTDRCSYESALELF